MHLLLPPSETKRPGGAGGPVRPAALRYGAPLRALREETIDALTALSRHPDAARILKLSPRQEGELAVNAAFRASGTMPAIERYTGVLFDALDVATLSDDARSWLAAHADIHSAPLGPVGAFDDIPAYRLSAGTALPGFGSLKRRWAAAAGAALAERGGLVLDLRSESYAALGPMPDAVYVRVVAEREDGVTRALNHFNKRAKGVFARALAESAADVRDRVGLLRWAGDNGFDLRAREGEHEVLLVWNEVAAARR